MTPQEFDALFDSFHVVVFRLETLPAYDVGGDADRLAAFRAGRPLPERSVRTSPWLARIALSTAEGKQWERVRVVDTPLTEYQEYELLAYQESQAAGERITIAPRSRAIDVGPDFWLFDPDTPEAHAVLMNYAPGGQWLGATSVVDPGGLRALADIRRAALAMAVPLNTFLVEARG